MTVPYHPLANLFPLIEGDAFAEMVEDVRAFGVREKIKLLDGMILDGRNRYRAALAAGLLEPEDGFRYASVGDNGEGSIKPPFTPFVPQIDGDPFQWVLSKNLHRRHMTDSQLAMVAVDLATMRQGERTDLPPIEGRSEVSPQLSQKQAAEMLHVSVTSVERAAVVRAHGVEGLAERVKQGELAVSVAEQIARLPVGDQLAILRGADPKAFRSLAAEKRRELTVQKKARREERVNDLAAKQVALPTRLYGLVLADPEWEHKAWSDGGMHKAAANIYPVSDLETIKQRDVRSIAADDCVLFMWTTVPHLQQAFDVVEAWGFTYKSSAIWHKQYPGAQQGMGYWFRINHEILIVATRGNIPAPAPGTQFGSVIVAPVGAHSEKPAIVHEMIEALYGALPKIELNARVRRPGWDVWGFEAPEESLGDGDTVGRTGDAVANAVNGTENVDCDGVTGGESAATNFDIPEAMMLSGAPAGVSPEYNDAGVPSSGKSTPFIFDAKADRAIRRGFLAGRPRGVIAAEIGCLKTEVSERAQVLGVVHKSRQRA